MCPRAPGVDCTRTGAEKVEWHCEPLSDKTGQEAASLQGLFKRGIGGRRSEYGFHQRWRRRGDLLPRREQN